MTGSLQEKSGTYYAVVRIPDETGKGKQKWISTGIKVAGNNKREATKKLRKILAELEESKITYMSDILFVDWINKWMEQKRNEIRLSTWESYGFYIHKHIEPYFKPLNLTLNRITPQHIQDYYGLKITEGLSANTIHKHRAVIRGALQEALRKNFITYDPSERATLPTKKTFVSQVFTLDQANELLIAIDNEQIKPAIILGLFYGLRRSEVLGLRFSDIDFDANTIHICNTVVKVKTLIEAEQTKSRSSNRILYIIPETKDYFLNLLQRQNENRILLGNTYNVGDHVCVWDDGRPFLPNYLSHRFSNILKENGLPSIRFHELRHTAGSLLLNKGLSAKQIQEYLGHEKVSTTLDIYRHLDTKAKMEAAFTIGALLDIKTL